MQHSGVLTATSTLMTVVTDTLRLGVETVEVGQRFIHFYIDKPYYFTASITDDGKGRLHKKKLKTF